MIKNKVFGYVRNNNAIPLNGHGLKRQERVIKRYARMHNLELVKIFREKGCSGSREERPTLAKMMLSLGRNNVCETHSLYFNFFFIYLPFKIGR